MKTLDRVLVLPELPEPIERLEELAYNLWWSWNPEAATLFETLDPALWLRVNHNPVKLLRFISQERLNEAANDPAYLERYQRVMRAFDAYMNATDTWFARTFPDKADKPIAYFSAEFGLHESLPIYSGGLGVLAGDHCKTASDLGIPLVGVGFLYPQGYFQQRISADGTQEAIYEKINFEEVPVQPAKTPEGDDAYVSVELPGRTVTARVWKIQVGRVPLYLLDTDVDPNAPEDRELAARLYGGDNEMRLSQEIILGIGGVRALRVLGIEPVAWHMNEGHSAFLGLERVRELVEEHGLSFAEAREAVAASTLFTTHTPVPAGHDAFTFDLIERYFYTYWPRLGLSREEFFALAHHDLPWGPRFSMTVLALRLSAFHNGVSELHGHVSREMWQELWPGVPVEEIPIGHITNGVHFWSWIAPELAALFDKYLPTDWRDRIDDPAVWQALDAIPDEELWALRRQLKEQMIDALRARVTIQRTRHGQTSAELRHVAELLDPNALTIGFARRFATYKRATLFFRDLERAHAIITNSDRPVQIIFAGKAHPADEPGKALIKRITEISKMPGFKDRVLFVEDYDMHVARLLTHGVDIWMNNPRRPLEASGTSGMKAAINGVPNFSVLDGWWREAYDGTNGWPIGDEREYASEEEQDDADARSLYETLENDIVPLYFDRDEEAVPHAWLQTVRASIRTVAPQFNTVRMLKEYVNLYYIPAAEAWARFTADNFARARALAAWKQRVRAEWPRIRLVAERPSAHVIHIREPIRFSARAWLGNLTPDDVRVEVAYRYERDEEKTPIRTITLTPAGLESDGSIRFEGELVPEENGRLEVGVRVVPHHEDLLTPHALALITWAE